MGRCIFIFQGNAIKTTERYHFTPNKRGIIKKTDDPQYWQACETTLLSKKESPNCIYNIHHMVLVDQLQVELSPLFWALSIPLLIQLDFVLAPADLVIKWYWEDLFPFTTVMLIPSNLFHANDFSNLDAKHNICILMNLKQIILVPIIKKISLFAIKVIKNST